MFFFDKLLSYRDLLHFASVCRLLECQTARNRSLGPKTNIWPSLNSLNKISFRGQEGGATFFFLRQPEIINTARDSYIRRRKKVRKENFFVSFSFFPQAREHKLFGNLPSVCCTMKLKVCEIEDRRCRQNSWAYGGTFLWGSWERSEQPISEPPLDFHFHVTNSKL